MNRRSFPMLCRVFVCLVPLHLAGQAQTVAAEGRVVPRFVEWATKDASSANLQKIQILKGWADADGQTYEQVFDVVCADGLEPDGQTRTAAPTMAHE